jgi:hypothetical protein
VVLLDKLTDYQLYSSESAACSWLIVKKKKKQSQKFMRDVCGYAEGSLGATGLPLGGGGDDDDDDDDDSYGDLFFSW